MPKFIINRIVDTLARTEILDLEFILTDLVDIPLSDEGLSSTAFYDALAVQTAAEDHNKKSTPTGKQVI